MKFTQIYNLFYKLQFLLSDLKDRTWTFALSDYEDLMKRISILQRDVKLIVYKIPEFVIKQMSKPIQTYSDDELNIIEPKLLDSLYQFQREGVLYGISRGGRFLLGDDMGLGKTRQALAVASYYRNEWPLLIVATAATRDMWSDQVFELLPSVNCADVVVIRSSKEMISSAKVVICSYSSMDSSMKKLELMNFGVVIFDESHSIKNSKAKQTINATKIGQKAKRVILITGTPALSRPSELYAQLAIINKKFVDYIKFTQRYCGGRSTNFGWEANGAEHLDELNILLNKAFMIRRTKKDVNLELDDKKREVVMMNNFKLSTEDAKDMSKFKNQYHSVEGKKQAQNDILLNWYASTAKIKAPAVCQYLKSTISKSNDKFLIFASHHFLMDEISSTLTKSKIRFIRIDGSTRSNIRNSLVSSFQNQPEIKCAILSIRACSAGITLTAASHVIFAELDWTPSIINQAEGRAHRIGQEKQVHSTFLIAPGTADEIIWKRLNQKQKNLEKLGLVAKNENLSEHEVRQTFCEPSTSHNQITNYFEKKPSLSDTIETEEFFSCDDELSNDTVKNLENQFIQCDENDSQLTEELDLEEIDKIDSIIVEAKKSSEKPTETVVNNLLDDIDLDDDDDDFFN